MCFDIEGISAGVLPCNNDTVVVVVTEVGVELGSCVIANRNAVSCPLWNALYVELLDVDVVIAIAVVFPSDVGTCSGTGTHDVGSGLCAKCCTNGNAIVGPNGNAIRVDSLCVDIGVAISFIYPNDEGATSKAIGVYFRVVLNINCSADGFACCAPFKIAITIEALCINIEVANAIALVLPNDDCPTLSVFFDLMIATI